MPDRDLCPTCLPYRQEALRLRDELTALLGIARRMRNYVPEFFAWTMAADKALEAATTALRRSELLFPRSES